MAEELQSLVETCVIEEQPPIAGWEISQWSFSEEAVDALLHVYRRLLEPSIQAAVRAQLEADGVNLGSLLRDEAGSNDRITRSDLTELGGAASLIAGEGIDPLVMVLPNVPKGTRSISERGIDIVAATLTLDGDPSELRSGERLLLCSVKHTVADGRDMYQKLRRSLDGDLTAVYVTSQVRVLHGRLQERGVAADRIWLAIRNFPDPRYVRLVGIGAGAQAHIEEFLDALRNLPEVEVGSNRIISFLIPTLSDLPERV